MAASCLTFCSHHRITSSCSCKPSHFLLKYKKIKENITVWPLLFPSAVCLKGTKINGKCYLADPVRKRYHAASEDCNNLGGVLGTPMSSDENDQLRDYIRQSIGQDERIWLGINDMAAEGSWVNQSSLSITYKNWDTSSRGSPQPDGGTSQNCAVLSGASGGKWFDENCREEKPSVCQFNIV